MAKSKLDLTIKPHKVLPERCGTVVVKGEGNKDYQFPDHFVGRVLGRTRRPRLLSPPSITVPGASKFFLPQAGGFWDFIKPAVAKVDDSNFQGLIDGADIIQKRIISRQSDFLMERFFGDMQETALLASKQMDSRYQGAIADHQRQVKSLRQQVEKAFPQLVKELAQRNAGVPVPVLMQHALQMLAQELSPIIGVLSIYTDAFRQRLSGRYERMLKALDFYMEENFLFWQTGSLDMALAGAAVPTLPTSSFNVGDVLLSFFGGEGLGTVPGSKGPIGLHLLMLPFDMQGWMPPGLPLCNHESRHQIYHDVKGLERDQQLALRSALIAGAKSSAFTLSTEKVRIGRFSAPLLDLIVKIGGPIRSVRSTPTSRVGCSTPVRSSAKPCFSRFLPCSFATAASKMRRSCCAQLSLFTQRERGRRQGAGVRAASARLNPCPHSRCRHGRDWLEEGRPGSA